MIGNKIAGRNATVLLGTSAAGMYAICDVAAGVEIDRKNGVEEIITYCEVEPVTGALTATMKGTIYAKKAGLNQVVSVAVTNVGSGYATAPAISFTGGGGTGAAATCVIDPVTGKIVSVFMTNNGTGYTTAPTVVFTGGGGSAAAATAKIVGYNSDWLEPLFSQQLSVGGRVYFEIRPDGDGSGKPAYTGYLIPTGWKFSIPEDKGAFAFEFDGVTNGWPVQGAQT